jgi:hypothetical protein
MSDLSIKSKLVDYMLFYFILVFLFLGNTSLLLYCSILRKTLRFPAGDQVLLACSLARGGVQGEEAEGACLPVGRMHNQVQQDFQGRNDHDQNYELFLDVECQF